MEEEIKILEEFIEKNIKSGLRTELNANELQAIENLIKGYKKLETINKMQEYRISVIDERELIPKSKVREKIEESKEMITNEFVCETYKDRYEFLVKYLEELLQEGDK